MSGDVRDVRRRLRWRVRMLVRASPGLSAESKLARRARRPSLVNIAVSAFAVCVGCPLLGIAVPCFLLLCFERIGGPDFALAIWSLWAVALMFWVADGVLRTIWLSPQSRLLKHLPVDDGVIVRRAIRESVSWAALGMLAGAWGFGFIAWRRALPPEGWFVAALFLVWQWGTAAAAGVALARLYSRAWYLTAAGCATSSMMFAALLTAIPANAARSIADGLYLLTPGGWAAAAWNYGYLQGKPWAWLGLAPAALIILQFLRTCREWPKRHVAIDSSDPHPAASQKINVPPAPFAWGEWMRWVAGADCDASDTVADSGLLAEKIRSRAFLRPGNVFGAGAGEWLCRRLLSPREQVVARWMVGDWLVVNEAGKGMMLVSLCFIGFNAAVGFRLPCFALLAFAALVTVFADVWRVFGTAGAKGDYLPLYSLLPIGYSEVARVAFTLSLIQCLQVVPGLSLAAAFDNLALGIAPGLLALGAVVVATLFIGAAMLRPLVYLLISSNILGMPWRRAHWTLALLVFGFLAGLAAMSQVPIVASPINPAQKMLALATVAGILFVSVHGLWRTCLWIEAQGYFDLNSPFGPANARREILRTQYRNCHARRLKYGTFWWLPRHMRAEKTHNCNA